VLPRSYKEVEPNRGGEGRGVLWPRLWPGAGPALASRLTPFRADTPRYEPCTTATALGVSRRNTPLHRPCRTKTAQ
jgi:hypothetical protein